MKFIDEYRNGATLRRGIERVRRRSTRPWVIMDVCGGQTHSLLRHGIEAALEGAVELTHGPGCPVCVTPAEVIDRAIGIAANPAVTVASFGDMLAVPGTGGSLLQARARGGDVRAVYSPLDAVRLAARDPARQVVFFAVGFETTAPATALAVLQAERLGLENFRVLAHHVRVEPVMRSIAAACGNRVEGFLAAGHVCTVTGYSHFEPFAAEFGTPIIVTGFEPLDLLAGLEECVNRLERGEPAVVNRYPRCVRPEGNAEAGRFIELVFEVADVPWRGFGVIPAGGLSLRSEYARFDARASRRADPAEPKVVACLSGDILSGRIKPPACPLFGSACTPETPAGAPMVSSEGACAAYFRYARTEGPVSSV
jgi:hydrogenase expression/formation protein HypD